MQGRYCFGHLTIEENLLTGAFTRRDGAAAIRADLDKVYRYFPRLAERRQAMAGYTSGGEQQMCAIGRALMSRPKMILLDEPSMGLAPQIVEEIFSIMKNLQRERRRVVPARRAERQSGAQVRQLWLHSRKRRASCSTGPRRRSRENEDVKEFYLGVAEGRRKSFREGKHYKRRKRWLAEPPPCVTAPSEKIASSLREPGCLLRRSAGRRAHGLEAHALRRRHALRHEEIRRELLRRVDPVLVEVGDAGLGQECIVDEEAPREVRATAWQKMA